MELGLVPAETTVFALLPVHNRWDQTRQCLDCLRKQTCGNLRVIVVDDGSTDGTSGFLKNEYPEATVLAGNGALWWAGGVNRGMEFALRSASPEDFLLILNNDLSFDGNFVASLCGESIERGRAGIAAMSVDRVTGEYVDTGVVVDWKRAKIVAAHSAEGPPREADAFSTRGLLLPVPVASAAGPLREKDLPHYLTDLEYTLRILKLGLPLYRSRAVTARLDAATTGLRVRPGSRSPWQDIRDHLFNYRSPSNIVHWIRFLRICCPGKYLPRWAFAVARSEIKFAVKALIARG
jgi:GT2 family glycosyltransferase